ncbi:hypothetical protein AAC387_Pa11g0511 [Persea americana]
MEETIVSSGAFLVPVKRLVPKQKVNRTQNCKPVSYINTLPTGLRPYIHHVKDVNADGNCGFRAIAGLMGLGEDSWQQVFLVQGHPIPPIATNWIRHHHPSADGWDIVYQSRIQHFREIISPSIATYETIDLE